MNARQWRSHNKFLMTQLIRLLGQYARDEMEKDEFILTMVVILLHEYDSE